VNRCSLPILIRRVARHAGVSEADIVGPERFPSIVRARVVLALAARELGYSFPEIGRAIGKSSSSVVCMSRRGRQVAALQALARCVIAPATTKEIESPPETALPVVSAVLLQAKATARQAALHDAVQACEREQARVNVHARGPYMDCVAAIRRLLEGVQS
jgi:hypothetical protein